MARALERLMQPLRPWELELELELALALALALVLELVRVDPELPSG